MTRRSQTCWWVAPRRAFSEGLPVDHLKTIHSAGADAAIALDILDAWLADEQAERERNREGSPWKLGDELGTLLFQHRRLTPEALQLTVDAS
jgi:hypothetical protein